MPNTVPRPRDRRRWAWLVVISLTVLAVAAELYYAPVAWDIVTYAPSFAEAHYARGAWSHDQYVTFLARSYVRNVGFLVLIALVPASLWLLMLRTGRRAASTETNQGGT